MSDHFSPVGKPAPPRPRRPEAFTSLTMASRPLSRMALVPSQAPRLRAPSRPQSPRPYRFLKMRSLSSSIKSLPVRSRASGNPGPNAPPFVLAALGPRFRGDERLIVYRSSARGTSSSLHHLEGGRAADRRGELPVDLRPGFHWLATGEAVQHL